MKFDRRISIDFDPHAVVLHGSNYESINTFVNDSHSIHYGK